MQLQLPRSLAITWSNRTTLDPTTSCHKNRKKKIKSSIFPSVSAFGFGTITGLELQVPPPLLPSFHDGQLCSKIMIICMSDAEQANIFLGKQYNK
jgi:hypothetical protein